MVPMHTFLTTSKAEICIVTTNPGRIHAIKGYGLKEAPHFLNDVVSRLYSASAGCCH